MPRAERSKNDYAKKLQDTSRVAGQMTLTGFFKKATEVEADDQQTSSPTHQQQSTTAETSANTETNQTINSVSASTSASTNTTKTDISICDPWIKSELDFSGDDRKRSEHKGRFFQAEWFNSHPWIWYNCTKLAIFCGVCTQFKQPRDISPFIFEDEAPGFRNWKKGKERIVEHEKSDIHMVSSHNAKKLQPDIDCQLDKQVNEQQRLRREGLVAHLNTMKTLLRQGLSLRGHNDEDSNIVQFNKDKAAHSDGLRLLMKENHFFSHDILTTQEQIIVLTARRDLLKDIKQHEFYSIICDESTDQ